MATQNALNNDGSVGKRPDASGLMSVAQQREIADVQAKMMIARMNPRSEKAALDRILQACTRPKLAQSALYSYSRGGTDVTGPSIRLAEAIAQSWGNFDFGVRELEQRPGESTVEAYAWDLESNVSQRKIFQVSHVRTTKKGSYVLNDPRDIYELVANNGARRVRACILGVIPGDIVESAVEQCESTLKTHVNVTPELIARTLASFADIGVTKEMIEARIQRRIEAITPALVVQLGKIYNSIKDGMSTPAEWFAPPEARKQESGTLKVDDLKPAAAAKKAEPEGKPAPDPELAGPSVFEDDFALDGK